MVYQTITPYPGYQFGYFKAFINTIIAQNKNTLKKRSDFSLLNFAVLFLIRFLFFHFRQFELLEIWRHGMIKTNNFHQKFA